VDQGDLLLFWAALFAVVIGTAAFVGHGGTEWFQRK
jgi:hypothetical protein